MNQMPAILETAENAVVKSLFNRLYISTAWWTLVKKTRCWSCSKNAFTHSSANILKDSFGRVPSRTICNQRHRKFLFTCTSKSHIFHKDIICKRILAWLHLQALFVKWRHSPKIYSHRPVKVVSGFWWPTASYSTAQTSARFCNIAKLSKRDRFIAKFKVAHVLNLHNVCGAAWSYRMPFRQHQSNPRKIIEWRNPVSVQSCSQTQYRHPKTGKIRT